MGKEGKLMDFSQRVSICRIGLAGKHPFFGTLCFYTEVRESGKFPTAWTDGRRIWFNPDFAGKLTERQFKGVLMHEVLHCALKHPSRREDRDPKMFNLAADIVVNEMILEAGLELPEGHVRYREWGHFSTEEVYNLLLNRCPPELQDFLKELVVDLVYVSDRKEAGELEAHWEIATQNAAMQARFFSSGDSPEWERLFNRITAPRIDWRTRLWEFMARTPCDYSGWDRRFIHQGLYLDALDGESCEVNICCDTSGSIGEEQLGQFLAEIQAIVSSYPAIHATLWFADTRLGEPHELHADMEIPTPTGGGGTSFIPFFDEIARRSPGLSNACAIYLTDGYGAFPQQAPSCPTLWVVTPGGLEDEEFPFGCVTRLVEP
jgi:predicted metal-dependent peptidase